MWHQPKSCKSVSETKYLTVVDVEKSLISKGKQGMLFLCDTPGFDDIGVIEVDIANGIGVINGVKSAKSIQPVFIISLYELDPKGVKFQEFIHKHIGIFSDIKDSIQTFNYYFTNFIWKKLMLELSKTKEIMNSSAAFRHFLSDPARASVKSQLHVIQISIRNALLNRNYMLVKFRLESLSILQEILHQPDITLKLNECLQDIEIYLKREYEQKIENLARSLSKRNTLKTSDIEEYLDLMDKAKLSDQFRNFSQEKLLDYPPSHFIEKVLIENIEKYHEDFVNFDSENLELKPLLEKLGLLGKYVPSSKNIYSKCLQEISKQSLNWKNDFINYLETYDFSEMANILSRLKKTQLIYNDFFTQNEFLVIHEECKRILIEKIQKEHQRNAEILKKPSLSEQDFEFLGSFLKILESQQSNLAFQSNFATNEIENLFQNFVALILTRLENLTTKVINVIETFEQNSDTDKIVDTPIEKNIQEIQEIRKKFVSLQSKTAENYHCLIIRFEQFLKSIQSSAEILISKMHEGKRETFNKIRSYMKYLENNPWIEKFLPTNYLKIQKSLIGNLENYLDEITEEIVCEPLTLDNSEKLLPVCKKYEQIIQIKDLDLENPILQKKIAKTTGFFEQTIKTEFENISNIFASFKKFKPDELLRLNLKKLEKGISYLLECRRAHILTALNPQKLLSEIDTNLNSYLLIFNKNLMELMTNLLFLLKKEETENLQKTVQMIEEYILEMKEFKSRLNIDKYFDPEKDNSKIRSLGRKLSELSMNISNDLKMYSTAGLNKDFTSLLSSLKYLLLFDKYFPEIEKSCNPKFTEIYDIYNEKYYSLFPEAKNSGTEAIKNFEIENILEQMNTLKNQKNIVSSTKLDELKRYLNFQIDDLLKKTSNLSMFVLKEYEFKYDTLLTIKNNIEFVEKALALLKNYLNDEKRISASVALCKKNLNTDLNDCLESIKSSLQNNDFSGVQRKIRQITLAIQHIEDICSPENLNKFNEVRKMGEEKITQMKKNFENCKIEDFSKNQPKQILNSLKEVGYQQIINEINDLITKNYQKTFNSIENYKKGIRRKEQDFRTLKNTLKYLPSDLETQISDLMTDALERLKEEGEKRGEDFKEIIINDNLNELKNFFKEVKEAGEIEKYKIEINKYIDESLQKAKVSLFDVRNQYNDLEKAFTMKESFGEHFPKIIAVNEEISSHMMKKFRENIQSFVSFKDNIPFKDEKSQSLQPLDVWIALMKKNVEIPKIMKEYLPEFTSESSQILMSFIKTFKEINDEFECFLETMEFEPMAETLTKIKARDQYLREILTEYSLFERLVPDLKLLKTVNNYNRMKEIIQEKIEKEKKFFEGINLESLEFGTSKAKRDALFKEINEKLFKFELANQIKNHILTFKSVSDQISKSIKEKLDKIAVRSKAILDGMFREKQLDPKNGERLNMDYNILESFGNNVTVTKSYFNCESEVNNIKSKIQTFLENSKIDGIKEAESLPKFKNNLLKLQVFEENIIFMKDACHSSIQEMLIAFKSKNGPQAIAVLGKDLEADPKGKTIIENYGIFEGYATLMFNQKTLKFGIDFVLSNIKGTNIDVNELKKKYQIFDEKYKCFVDSYLARKDKLSLIVDKIKMLVGELKLIDDKKFSQNIKAQIPELLAYIFSLWTLVNSSHFFEIGGGSDKNYLWQPHPAQVIAIFRILGVGDKKEELVNNLAQIKTGEGKSVTLAALSAVFALLGFNVSCACYSQYLSQRDFTVFQPLFERLEIGNFIKYGTFNNLCEEFIFRKGDIRKIVSSIFKEGKNNQKSKELSQRPEILLIDEVDVFFSPDFYGNLYTPSTTIRDQTIQDLILLIWEKRESFNLSLGSISKEKRYLDCVAKFKNWESLIQECVKNLVFDVKNFESQSYEIDLKHEKIGYKDQDQISYSKIVGYQTMFLYLKEFYITKRFKNKENLFENLGFIIKCGSYSYIKIPPKFEYILGVTGTLETLNEYEQKIVENELNIKRFTYVPSVYGKSNFQFSETADLSLKTRILIILGLSTRSRIK